MMPRDVVEAGRQQSEDALRANKEGSISDELLPEGVTCRTSRLTVGTDWRKFTLRWSILLAATTHMRPGP